MAGLAALAHEADDGSPRGELRNAALLGVAFGVGANVVALRFIPAVVARFTPLPWVAGVLALILVGLEQGLRWGVALVVRAALVRRGVPAWWAFATGIALGSFFPAVFPWTAAGGVTPVPEMVQLADTLGERGVTFLMALSAGLLAASFHAFRSRASHRSLLTVGAIGIPLVTYAIGHARIRTVEATRALAPTVKIGLLQPATDARARWDPSRAPDILARLTLGTQSAERAGAELTVWPEAAYPYPVAHATRRCPLGGHAMLPPGVRGPVLTGLIMTGGGGDLWNSATLCQTDGELTAPQDKVHLLWFGETLPGIDRIPWIRETFSRGTGLVAGDSIVLQRAGRVRASVLNCFEDTLPSAGREAMSVAPNLLVNVTNDAWFQGSEESELHLRLGVLRAVESRRDLVRAVNLGISSWVDAAGVVRARTASDAPAVLSVAPALLEDGPTLFDRWGDLPLLVTLLLTSLLVMLHRMQKGATP